MPVLTKIEGSINKPETRQPRLTLTGFLMFYQKIKIESMNKPESKLFLMISVISLTILSGCATEEKKEPEKTSAVEANIKAYTHVWDEIMNKGKLDQFNDSNFTKDVVMHVTPADILGIDTARAYYAQFLTGFSEVQFTIKDVFGQDEKLVKHWNFKGKHTGSFFGIPATGKTVSIDGATLVRMSGGKIAEERDFFDNMDFMTQLGLLPAPTP